MTILYRESRLYSIVILYFLLLTGTWLLRMGRTVAKIAGKKDKNKLVPLTKNNKTIYNKNICRENKDRKDFQ